MRAYALMEAAQGHDHVAAGAALVALEADAAREHRDDVAFLAAAGQSMYALLWSQDTGAVRRGLDLLVVRAQSLGEPHLLGLALALRGLAAAGRDDSAALLADVARAVALIDDEEQPALDRCVVLVVCAAAYNALSLWELVDELYDRAALLEPDCERPVQAPAVAVNRVLVRLEWAAALFETGDRDGALDQLRRAAEAVEHAEATPGLPDLWRLEVRACRDALALVLGAFSGSAPEAWVDDQVALAAEHRAALGDAGDVEFLPLLDSLVSLSLHRLGRRDDAMASVRVLALPGSSSSGARSFPAWVRAEVLSADDAAGASEAIAAHREYGVLVARARSTAREGAVVAARSKIAGERLTADHARLARDVLLDPLTGLSNRRCFDDWLVDVPAHDRTAALLLIDMDDFKEVNDVHGHAVGDRVLRRVGELITKHVRPGDLALRLGGDEFAVVLEDDTAVPAGSAGSPDAVEAFGLAAQVRADAIDQAVACTDWDELADGLRVRVSIGVAVATLEADCPATADRLYRAADARLYGVKSLRDFTRAPD